MTWVDKFLETVRPYATSYVTFGDGAKGKIVGIDNLISEGLPRLDNVLLSVNFSKSEFQITDEKGKVSMKGTRSKDNCYL